ncbi:DUF4365 domain-containing protein [Variovorax rhizosphaerae]|uniref:DUF4365 domain-containing protein n=1 Tax=Variovorax rhizosphaerae TaxID=1836200 RepID=A0ABU8WT57_9BURK
MPDLGLPKTSDAQDIGANAVKCMHVNLPTNWRPPQSMEGTDDFGFDFHVQFVEDHQAKEVFRVQLKGTTDPKKNASGEYISIELSASTLRYYAGVAEPILLVLCDLSVDSNPKRCPAYYVWLREELLRVGIQAIPPDQKGVTLRVPTSNKLDDDADLREDVRRANALAEVGHALDVGIAKIGPNLNDSKRLALAQGVGGAVEGRSLAFVEALAAPPKGFWIEPPRGTIDWHLWSARKRLDSGQLTKARTELDAAASMLSDAAALAVAEYWLLRGRLATAEDDSSTATSAFKTAAETHSDPRFLSAWAESELRRRYHPDKDDDYSDVVATLPGDDPSILSVKARLLAASGKYDDAMRVVESFDGPDSLAARAVIETMFSKIENALAACESGLARSDAPDSTRHLFQILKARARFNLALQGTPVPNGDLVSPAGPKGIDASLLREAWTDIQVAVEIMDESNWSSNADFVVDIWIAAAAMLGIQREILPALVTAAAKRPHTESVQSACASLAAQCGEFETALAANSRLPDGSTKFLREIAFLHEKRAHTECVFAMELREKDFDPKHQLFADAIACAALSAAILVRSELVDHWSSLLDQLGLEAERAALDYRIAELTKPFDRGVALKKLEGKDQELAHPLPTTIRLLEAYDPHTSTDEAQRLLDVARRLLEKNRLFPALALRIASPMMVLNDWNGLVALGAEAEREFGSNSRIDALKAFALDHLGEAEAAKQILERLLDDGTADTFALNTYVNIVVRWGQDDKAITAVEKLLARSTDQRQQLECFQLLFKLVQKRDSSSPRLVDLAQRVGQLANQQNEIEEGVFLSMMMLATASGTAKLSSEHSEAISSRMQAFFKRFPESRVFKSVEVPHDVDGDELLTGLKRALGITEDRERFLSRAERLLQQGLLPLPYSWRPTHLLSNVHDLVYLWELTKKSGIDDRKYHLSMAGADWVAKPVEEVRKRTPLIDLVTFLLLRDLGLLDKVFEFFGKVAVAQSTIELLEELTQPLGGSLFPLVATSLQSDLRARSALLLQPRAEFQVANPPFSRDSHETKALAADARYQLYSDDASFRTWCLEGREAGICTLDVLYSLTAAKLITGEDAARKVAQLCRWRVGLQVTLNDQLALLPAELGTASNIEEGVGVLHAAQDFMAVANAIWDFRLDLNRTMRHVSEVARELVASAQIPEIVIGSFVGVWYVKAKLRKDAPHPARNMLPKLLLLTANIRPMQVLEAARLWMVFIDLFAFEVGDSFTESSVGALVRQVAEEAADSDALLNRQGIRGTLLHDRLRIGLAQSPASTEFDRSYATRRRLNAAAGTTGRP